MSSPGKSKAEKGSGFSSKIIGLAKKAISYVRKKPTHSKPSENLLYEKQRDISLKVSSAGIDEKGNLVRDLVVVHLIRHIDIQQCGPISLYVETENCNIEEAHIFERFV